MSELERGLVNEESVVEPDLPPEFCRYRDEGCELADSCLNCPFPQCIYEQPRGKQRWLKKARDLEICRHDEGLPCEKLERLEIRKL